MKAGISNRLRTGSIVQRVLGLLLSAAMLLQLTGCDTAGEESSATVVVQVPKSVVANLQRAAYSINGVPSTVTEILIDIVVDGYPQIPYARATITGSGGEMKLKVPAERAFTVYGVAFQGTTELYYGSTDVAPIRPRSVVTVGLILRSSIGNTSPISISARTQVDTNVAGEPGNSVSGGAILSSDNRYVLFRSDASNLVPGDSNKAADLFQKDLATNAIGAITVFRRGETFGFAGTGDRPYGMSSNGQFVVFAQRGTKLNPLDTNDTIDVFIKDTATSSFVRLFEGPSASSDAGFPHALSLSSNAQRMVVEAAAPPLGQSSPGIYVFDRILGLRFVDSGVAPTLSADGRTIAFWTFDSFINTYQLVLVDVDLLYANASDPEFLSLYSGQGAANVPDAVGLSDDGQRISLVGRQVVEVMEPDQPLIYDRNTLVVTRLNSTSGGSTLQSATLNTDSPSLSITGDVASFTFGDAETVYVKDSGNGNLVAVSNNAANATISPDSTLVSFTSEGHLFVDNNPLLTPSAVTTAPTVKTVTLNNQVTLTWDPVVGATSYDIYASTDPNVSASNFQVKFGSVSSPYTVTSASLPVSGTYYFVVVPVNVAGQTGPASTAGSPVQAGPTPSQFTVSATIVGLNSPGLTVDLYSGSIYYGGFLVGTATTSVTFDALLASGANYSVVITKQPTGQVCVATNASGTIATSNVTNVNIVCTSQTGFTVGGSVNGLTGDGLKLEILENSNIVGGALIPAGSTSFVYSGSLLSSGSTYNVFIVGQPTGQSCTGTNLSGTIGTSNVTNIVIDCVSTIPDHTTFTSGCFSCHDGVTAIGKPANHLTTTNECQACHNKYPALFLPIAFFDHTQALGSCSSCHNGVLAIGKTVNHIPTTLDCGVCHNTTTFLGAVAVQKSYGFFSIQDVTGSSISAVNSDFPSDPVIIEQNPVTSSSVGILGASFDAATKTIFGFYTYAIVYIKDTSAAAPQKRIFRVSGTPGPSGPEAPVQISTELSACNDEGVYEDFSNPANSRYLYLAAGPDTVCGTSDDLHRMVRIGMSSTELPIELGTKYLVTAINDWSNGSLAYWLVQDGSLLQRCDANLTGCSTVVSGVTFVTENASNSLDRKFLLTIDGVVRVYDVAANTLSPGVLTLQSGDYVSSADWDGTRFFFVRDGLAPAVFSVPDDGSSAATTPLATVQSGANLEISGNQLVISTSFGIDSVPKTGGSLQPLVTAESGGYVSVFQVVGGRVYFLEYSALGVPSAGTINADGSGLNKISGSKWIGWSGIRPFDVSQPFANINLFEYFFRVEGYDTSGQGLGFAGGSIRTIDPASASVAATVGTLPSNLKDAYCYSFGASSFGYSLCTGLDVSGSTDVLYVEPTKAGSLSNITNSPSIDESTIF